MNRINYFLASVLMVLWAPLSYAACLQPPIPGTTITSNFGMRFHPVKKIWRLHAGTDMRARMYTKVNAAHAGQVTYSGYFGGGGNALIVLSPDGTQTRYLHLSKAGVRQGSVVAAGQEIAFSGNTGHASAAPHLHFEARLDNGSRPVDPRSLLCQGLPEKNGAGPETSGNGKPPPGNTGNPTSGGSPNPSGGSGVGGFNSFPDFNGYEGMSEQEIFKIEAERRFFNTDWHIKIGGCGNDINQQQLDGSGAKEMDCKVFFRQELLSMTALQNWIDERKMLTKERIQAMRATRAIDSVKASNSLSLDLLRQKANAQAK